MKSANERDDKTMETFRKELVALFVDHFGKTSPNAMAVKTAKSVFPNDVNLEHDSEHQEFFRGMYNMCPSLTMHISHLTAVGKAAFSIPALKEARMSQHVVLIVYPPCDALLAKLNHLEVWMIKLGPDALGSDVVWDFPGRQPGETAMHALSDKYTYIYFHVHLVQLALH